MKLTVLIPVKSIDKAKSRLKKYLTPRERRMLVMQMLQHVIETLKNTKAASTIYIVTDDVIYKNVADAYNVSILMINVRGMNSSLTKAAKEINDSSLLILSADLPLLVEKDIEHILHLSKSADIVLASSKEGTGTNALFLKQSASIPFLFGDKSLQRFINAANEKNLKVAVYENETISFDIDTFSDYIKYQNLKS